MSFRKGVAAIRASIQVCMHIGSVMNSSYSGRCPSMYNSVCMVHSCCRSGQVKTSNCMNRPCDQHLLYGQIPRYVEICCDDGCYPRKAAKSTDMTYYDEQSPSISRSQSIHMSTYSSVNVRQLPSVRTSTSATMYHI
jgi:hypothetical protein